MSPLACRACVFKQGLSVLLKVYVCNYSLKNSGQFRYISAFTRVFMLPVTLIEVLAIAVSIVMVVKAKNSLFSYLLPF